MTIKDFTDIHDKKGLMKAVLYDFTMDAMGVDLADKYRKEDAFGRYVVYTSFPGYLDPDVQSYLLQEVYKKVWKNTWPADWVASDTMTSFNSKLIQLLQLRQNDELDGKKLVVYKREAGNKAFSKELFVRWYNDKKINRDKLFDFCGPVLPLLQVYHTIGNFCPVPPHFNVARSGSHGNYDYWDLTLNKIHECYFPKNEKVQDIIEKQLFHGNSKGDVNACLQWINSYGQKEEGWKKFIELNFMQDYVDDDYNPKPFVKGHTWENNRFKNIKNMMAFSIEAERRIIKRGIRIISCMNSDLTFDGKELDENGIDRFAEEIIMQLNKNNMEL